MACAALPLTLDLGDLRHQEPDLVAIEFGDRGNGVDDLGEVLGVFAPPPAPTPFIVKLVLVAPTE
jgi:hypothetical protein